MTEPLTYQLEAIDKQTLDLLKTTEHVKANNSSITRTKHGYSQRPLHISGNVVSNGFPGTLAGLNTLNSVEILHSS